MRGNARSSIQDLDQGGGPMLLGVSKDGVDVERFVLVREVAARLRIRLMLDSSCRARGLALRPLHRMKRNCLSHRHHKVAHRIPESSRSASARKARAA